MIPPWLTGSLRDFAQWMRPRALKVVDWKPLVTRSVSMAGSLFSGGKHKALFAHLQTLLPSPIIFVGEAPTDAKSAIQVENPAEKKEIGMRLLEIYFGQFLSQEGFFFDLALESFQWSASTKQLHWEPSRLRTEFEQSFQLNLLRLYAGYYTEDEGLYTHALVELGLIKPGDDEATADEVKGLLRKHFGIDQQHSVVFNREAFKDSFASLFELLEEHQLRLPSDFAFLGLYLYALYHALEELGGSYDVRKVFDQSGIKEYLADYPIASAQDSAA